MYFDIITFAEAFLLHTVGLVELTEVGELHREVHFEISHGSHYLSRQPGSISYTHHRMWRALLTCHWLTKLNLNFTGTLNNPTSPSDVFLGWSFANCSYPLQLSSQCTNVRHMHTQTLSDFNDLRSRCAKRRKYLRCGVRRTAGADGNYGQIVS